jgi:hypothetical protein
MAEKAGERPRAVRKLIKAATIHVCFDEISECDGAETLW